MEMKHTQTEAHADTSTSHSDNKRQRNAVKVTEQRQISNSLYCTNLGGIQWFLLTVSILDPSVHRVFFCFFANLS